MINKGDKVQLRGFQPMSTMEHYEGAHGVVVDIEPNSNLGDVVFVQLDNDKIIQTRRQFCERD